MKLKVCGMKYQDNMTEVAILQPEYFGFVFYENSPRYFSGTIPTLPKSIKKVGVFVDARIDGIIDKTNHYNLNLIQLHGTESPEYCNELKTLGLHIIKAFPINKNFDFHELKPFESICDYYLFDTKGKLPGGNGYTFNWEILKNYTSTKPFFLSGGISLDETENIKEFLQRHESHHCHAIDINSKFEIKPGLKDLEKLKEFKSQI